MVQYSATAKYHEFLSAITQHAAEGILAYSAGGKIILANNAVSLIFDSDPKNIEGSNIVDLFAQGGRQGAIVEQLFQKSEGGEQSSLEFEIVRRNGVIVPLDIVVGHATLSDGESVFIANCRDITTQKKTAKRLTRQAEIINQMHDVVVVADRDLEITFCNKAMEVMAARTRDQMLGKTIHDVVHLVLPNGLEAADVKKIAATEGRWNGVSDVTNHEGKVMKADVVLFPMRDSDGQIEYFIFVIRDISDRLEADKRIQETQRIESLGRLAGGVAHDINNLLFPIFLNLEDAVDSIKEGNDLDDACEKVQASMDACMKIKKMIEQIMHFSRGSSAGRESLEMTEVLEDAWKLTKMIVPSSQKTIVTFQDDCGTVFGNSVQISQILLNLISNSVAAQDHGPGTITVSMVRAKSGDLRQPRYYQLKDQDYAVLTVTDTGSGIPNDIIDQVFDPFFTTKSVGEGTGLGLTEVAGIMSDFGGAIDVESKVDEGTSFFLYFPVTDKQDIDMEEEGDSADEQAKVLG